MLRLWKSCMYVRTGRVLCLILSHAETLVAMRVLGTQTHTAGWGGMSESRSCLAPATVRSGGASHWSSCPQLHGAQSCVKSRSSFPSVEPVHAVPPRGPVPARPPGVGRHSGQAGSWGAGGAGGRTIHQAECHLGFLSPSQLCPQAPQFCPRGRHKGTLLLSSLRCPRGLRSSRASPPWTPHLPLPWLGESPYSANSYHVISPRGFWGSSPL